MCSHIVQVLAYMNLLRTQFPACSSVVLCDALPLLSIKDSHVVTYNS